MEGPGLSLYVRQSWPSNLHTPSLMGGQIHNRNKGFFSNGIFGIEVMIFSFV